MHAGPPSDRPEVSTAHRKLLWVATGVTFLLVLMGGIVCITGAARACPDWPGCYGRVVPPPRVDAVTEYVHRLLALGGASLIAAAAVLGWVKYRHLRWISVPPSIAIALVFAVATFGAMAVLYGLAPPLATVDLGMALWVLALMVATSLSGAQGGRSLRFSAFYSGSFGKLTLCTFVAVFSVLVTGPMVEVNGPLLNCLAWPLYAERSAAASGLGAARYFVADFAAFCIAVLVIHAWRTKRGAPALLRTSNIVAALLGALFALSAFIGPASQPLPGFIYIGLTVGLWTALVALVMLAALASEPDVGGASSVQDALGAFRT
ncbi:MAG: hypothetical protein A3G25_03800 [Betaproteobacteria bacterium RIFCSPLOWO2_12_FULL_63_13]|nr:MAG: hypothetical protein A3H32_11720 [Betaproteobacteria bacterium RIFCSPLOWO2_02_FULL_63_19]OGA47114.1 MAG: hypothetical protein A3G25_03800 [Betaproteobacteria bacterium RIFCSPLOWO2_12_FULL_63_13]